MTRAAHPKRLKQPFHEISRCAVRAAKEPGDTFDFVRFLFLSSGFSRDGANTDLLQMLAEELVRQGHRCDIISMGIQGHSIQGPVDANPVGLRAYVLGHPPRWASRRGPAKYAPNVWRLNMNRGLARWLDGPYDLFLFVTPGVLSAGIGQRLRRAGKVKRVGFLLWDFFPITQVEAGSLSLGVLEAPLVQLERMLAKTSDVLLPMSPSGGRFAKRYYGLESTPTRVLPPWGSPMDFPEDASGFQRFTCAWGGQMIAKRAIPDLLRAASLLAESGVEVDFRLAGDGPLLPKFIEMAHDLGLSNVHFEGRLTRTDYLALLARSDAALSVIEPATSPSFPSKTVDYCQAGLPVIASVEEGNDYGRILESAGAGIATTAGDPVGIADAVRRAIGMTCAERQAMSSASRRFFDEHLNVAAAAATIVGVAREPQ